MNKILAPFTPEQVVALNEFQRCDDVHPFTCGGSRCDDNYGDRGARVMRATEAGWVCDGCDYTQNWAWSWMAQRWTAPR